MFSVPAGAVEMLPLSSFTFPEKSFLCPAVFSVPVQVFSAPAVFAAKNLRRMVFSVPAWFGRGRDYERSTTISTSSTATSGTTRYYE